MQLKTTNPHSNIQAAQIVGMSGTRVTVKTEDGQTLRLPISSNNQQDRIFLDSLKDIWKAKIWIPVNTKLHKLFRYDWLAEPVKVDD